MGGKFKDFAVFEAGKPMLGSGRDKKGFPGVHYPFAATQLQKDFPLEDVKGFVFLFVEVHAALEAFVEDEDLAAIIPVSNPNLLAPDFWDFLMCFLDFNCHVLTPALCPPWCCAHPGSIPPMHYAHQSMNYSYLVGQSSYLNVVFFPLFRGKEHLYISGNYSYFYGKD